MSAIREALVQAALLIADAIERDSTAPSPASTKRRVKRARVRTVDAPARPVSEVDAARARRLLAEKGIGT